MRRRKFVVAWKYRRYPDAFDFTRRTDACELWRRFLTCQKVKQDSMDSISTKVNAAPELIFLEQEAIIIQQVKHTRNTQVTCRRCWHAEEMHTCL